MRNLFKVAKIRHLDNKKYKTDKYLRKFKTMVQNKVTRKELREMHIGQTRIFLLTERKKLSSACVTCHQLKDEEGLEFKAKADFEATAISITRIK